MLATLHRLEAWHHKRRWARRNIHRLREADVVVVSHTKSGRTWLRVMISYLYHLRYGTPATEIMKFDNLHQRNPAIPKIYFTRDTLVPTFSWREGAVRISIDKRLLILVRDPRDVAVSFYFHVRNRASSRELERKGIPVEARSLSLLEFVRDEHLGVPRVIAFMNRWHREMEAVPQSLVVKYEELRAHPDDTLMRVMSFIGGEFDRGDIARAVEFGSFESLSSKEAEGFFDTGRLQPTQREDRDTYKVRRGKVGGYRDYFTDEQVAEIDALLRSRLLPDYGYS